MDIVAERLCAHLYEPPAFERALRNAAALKTGKDAPSPTSRGFSVLMDFKPWSLRIVANASWTLAKCVGFTAKSSVELSICCADNCTIASATAWALALPLGGMVRLHLSLKTSSRAVVACSKMFEHYGNGRAHLHMMRLKMHRDMVGCQSLIGMWYNAFPSLALAPMCPQNGGLHDPCGDNWQRY